jgi:hypothetical protein
MPMLRRLLICVATRRWAETWAAVYELGYQAGAYDTKNRCPGLKRLRLVEEEEEARA